MGTVGICPHQWLQNIAFTLKPFILDKRAVKYSFAPFVDLFEINGPNQFSDRSAGTVLKQEVNFLPTCQVSWPH